MKLAPRQRTFYRPITSRVATAVGSPAFAGRTRRDFGIWQQHWRKGFTLALKHPKRKVSLRLDRGEKRSFRDYIREKVVFDVERGLSACGWLCRPRRMMGQSPAVLCCHGHGPGKDPMVGLWRGERCLEYHKLVAMRLAQRGYVTLTLDRRGYGERSEFPNGFPTVENLVDLDRLYRESRGTSLLAMDIWDHRCAVDALQALAEVDGLRIACLGIETGAVIAASVGALDPRVRAAVLGAFLDGRAILPPPFDEPLLHGRVGPVELCGLVCPKPLMLQLPQADTYHPFVRARQDAKRIKEFYRLNNRTDDLTVHIFDGVLELDVIAAMDWLDCWSNNRKNR